MICIYDLITIALYHKLSAIEAALEHTAAICKHSHWHHINIYGFSNITCFRWSNSVLVKECPEHLATILSENSSTK